MSMEPSALPAPTMVCNSSTKRIMRPSCLVSSFMQTLQKAVSIFIFPPSLEILQKRLAERGTDSSEEQASRFQKAKDEMNSYAEYHYTIRNERLELAIQELQAVVVAERVRTTHVDPAHVFR